MQKIINYGSFAALLLLLFFAYMDYKKNSCSCCGEGTTETTQAQTNASRS